MAKKEVIQFVQKSLGLSPDGIVGPMTIQVLDMAIEKHGWSVDRKIIGYFQTTASNNGFEPGPVDGYWGPQTQTAWDIIGKGDDAVWRDDEGLGGDVSGGDWPLQTQQQLTKFYGDVGTNQTSVVVPYKLKLAWNLDNSLTKFTCHKKLVEPIQQVLESALDHYGQEEITRLGLDLWGGCLNVRKMRGGTKYSTHSWGCAIDWDPGRNRLRWGKDKAHLAKDEYKKWWELWEGVGAVSLGRIKNYDWMHVQFCRVK